MNKKIFGFIIGIIIFDSSIALSMQDSNSSPERDISPDRRIELLKITRERSDSDPEKPLSHRDFTRRDQESGRRISPRQLIKVSNYTNICKTILPAAASIVVIGGIAFMIYEGIAINSLISDIGQNLNTLVANTTATLANLEETVSQLSSTLNQLTPELINILKGLNQTLPQLLNQTSTTLQFVQSIPETVTQAINPLNQTITQSVETIPQLLSQGLLPNVCNTTIAGTTNTTMFAVLKSLCGNSLNLLQLMNALGC
jgi:hypothetical protein